MKAWQIQRVSEQFENFQVNFASIPTERKSILEKLADYITVKLKNNQRTDLIFICTHNSRRSHMAQIWAQAAATYFGIDKVHCYSGGTEATAFHPYAIEALQTLGFEIVGQDNTVNPVYTVQWAKDVKPLRVFSKRYDSEVNPQEKFAAVMTCAQADGDCPVVSGCDIRISLPYDDPKDFDGTPQQRPAYLERSLQIGLEMTYAMRVVFR